MRGVATVAAPRADAALLRFACGMLLQAASSSAPAASSAAVTRRAGNADVFFVITTCLGGYWELHCRLGKLAPHSAPCGAALALHAQDLSALNGLAPRFCDGLARVHFRPLARVEVRHLARVV